ncbi:MAG: hypothetical protein H7Z37_05020 [Pyrinomonadaceae bacterium]|nr:hypothetical protein [Pyrinomonadaceae bacterium]
MLDTSAEKFIPRLKIVDYRSQKLDAIKWRGGICFESYGVKIGVRFNRPEVSELVKANLPFIHKPLFDNRVDFLFSLIGGGYRREKCYLYQNGELVFKQRSTRWLPVILESKFRFLIAEFAPRDVFVHAGAVVWKGQAIVLPGNSYAGKTTLTAALVKAGATYYSDDFAVITEKADLLPYPKTLAMREENEVAQTNYTVESFGGVQGTKTEPVKLIVLARYERGAKWNPQTLTSGQAMLETLVHTIPAQRKPQQVLRVLSKVTEQATVLKGQRGDATSTAQDILNYLN